MEHEGDGDTNHCWSPHEPGKTTGRPEDLEEESKPSRPQDY